ncbi:BDR-repeat family protein [Borrelia duttonii CR2A]|uniref:BDR-repeat family protein n=1 Tax=Borrelia duttonii CR2A TaxID=1432657 RepID=W6TVN9_9SPIR|nr:Bdr family repetitive protein [Borrelia duttonii]ETZ17056.1 BDR-repeat family protein [Borrelia duttonii CR2A]
MYNNYIRRFFMEYMQMEPVITRQMVFNELVKAGINREIADDLSYRYYKNELTIKDLQYLESNFNLKLEILERSLKADIEKVKDALDTKIDTKFNELDTKIDKFALEVKGTFKLHAWMFGTIITLTIGILLTLIFK